MENSTQQTEWILCTARAFFRACCLSCCRNGCGGGALSPSRAGDTADGFAWSGPRGAGGYGVGFFGCAREHAARSAKHNAADVGGVVCDGASMFRIRCTGGVVYRQWSE